MQNPNIVTFDSDQQHLYVDLVKKSFDKSLNYQSKLPSWVLELEGMSGKKYRHFINNLISSVPNCRYLEIGCWKGSTLCSALYENNIVAYAVDNWSEFGGPKDEFQDNVNKTIAESSDDVDIDCQFEENHYKNIEFNNIGKYNVYLYDGPHAYEDQYNALTLGLEALDDEFIFICDDWNWDFLREATKKSIDDLNIEVLYSIELTTSQEDYEKGVCFQNSDWHNGYFISVCKRKTNK
jgi:hypothetical protein